MLTAKQVEERKGRLTASRVACLMSADEAEIYNLWLELCGDPSFVKPNFEDNWHVQLGNCTEQLNLDWFAKKQGPVSGRGTVIVHPDHDWAACTLDGWAIKQDCPIECKHLIGFTKTPEAAVKYYPQMHWQMWITGSDQCAFSAIQGGREPEVVYIQKDAAYEAELVMRAEAFMLCVRTLTPPVAAPALEGKAQVEAVREYDASAEFDFEGYKAWREGAAAWRAHRKPAKLFADTEKALKKLCPADATRVYGGGIEIVRNKAGSLSIREL